MIRQKQEWADLKQRYPKVVRCSMGISFVILLLCALFLPALESDANSVKATHNPFVVEYIPPTEQTKRPPALPRPAVPIETEDEDVPDDVTIAETDLDFDGPIIEMAPLRMGGQQEVEEEILEFWAVEEKPEVTRRVNPVYPEMARRAGLEGQVILTFTVTADGRATDIVVLHGAEIFRQAAVEAVAQFQFRPAKQNDRAVAVKMTMPMRFKLR